ncbi:hypothetical protein SCHPADRAFT_893096 [Schizopora paradoxa]|uniref:Uncharacterized protein n=1 Tax=Schizopora paradoxa TaxID=27342 RepID=A0A0H2RJ61_9AGAM|nr:hypothetical protein SCHPADRAFT_893096 [Schizopora paradoxa]
MSSSREQRPNFNTFDTSVTATTLTNRHNETENVIEKGGSDGSDIESEAGEQVHVEEKAEEEVAEQKSDLLLELAMTTAFASLTNGTPIVDASSVTSYLCFFALVWWVWASQVAYNVRFCTRDWIRRSFVCAQLVIFGTLASFTNDFDIFVGIQNDSSDQATQLQLQQDALVDLHIIAAGNARQNRLPRLNAKGISIVLGASRLVLLAQYICAKYIPRPVSGKKNSDSKANETKPRDKLEIATIDVHIYTLMFSIVCYFVALGVVEKENPSRADDIIKVVLWYLPVVVEIATHFILVLRKKFVEYPPDAVFMRGITLFTVVLGVGLDQVTQSFQFIVGNDSTKAAGVGLIISGAVIFLSQFALYFGMRKDETFNKGETGPLCKTILPWFFSHYMLLSSLIVVMQATAQIMQFGNIVVAMQTSFNLIQELNQELVNTNYNFTFVQETSFPNLIKPMTDIGLSVQTAIDFVNTVIFETPLKQVNPNGTDVHTGAQNAVLQYGVFVTEEILHNLNVLPDPTSELAERITIFTEYAPYNTTAVNLDTYNTILTEIYTMHAKPALWFFGAAGCTLLCYALLVLLKPRKMDAHRIGLVVIRSIFGFATIFLSLLDKGESNMIITADGNMEGSKIWDIASKSWILPIFAIILAVEQVLEYILNKKTKHLKKDSSEKPSN